MLLPLLQAGADPCTTDTCGYSPLHNIVKAAITTVHRQQQHPFTQLLRRQEQKQQEIQQRKMRTCTAQVSGANCPTTAEQSKVGQSCRHAQCATSLCKQHQVAKKSSVLLQAHMQAAEELLAHGADVNMKGVDGRTALQLAQQHHGCMPLIHVLTKRTLVCAK